MLMAARTTRTSATQLVPKGCRNRRTKTAEPLRQGPAFVASTAASSGVAGALFDLDALREVTDWARGSFVISLALKGKLPVTEDPLTAAFADLLRYEAQPELLRAILARCRPLVVGAASIPHFDSAHVELWPILAGREPDIRVELRLGGDAVTRLIVEAKLWAEKSGAGTIDCDARSGDQLGYYLKHEAERAPGRVALLYLTHHGAMPIADLHASAVELRSGGGEALAEELFWLSWRDVHDLLCAWPSRTRMIEDLVALLARVQMHRFKGVSERIVLGSIGAAAFYGGRRRQRCAVDLTTSPGELSRWVYRPRRARRPYEWPSAPALSESSFFQEKQ